MIIKDCIQYESPDILNSSELKKILKNYPNTNWTKIVDYFESTYKKIKKNGNIPLLVSGLIANIDDELK